MVVEVTPLELVLAFSGAERGAAFTLGVFVLLEPAVIPKTTPPTMTSSSTQLTAWVRIGRRRKRRHDLLTKVPEPDAATRPPRSLVDTEAHGGRGPPAPATRYDRPGPAGRCDSVQAGPAEMGRVDQGRVDQGRVDQGRVDQGRVDQGRVDQGRVDQGRVDGESRRVQTVSMAVTASLDIRPLSPIIGAEIGGLDLSTPLDPVVVSMLRAALAHHLVIFFRDQDLTPEQQAAFGRQFGELTAAHPVLASLEGHPQVLPIDGRVDRASWWHTDVTFLSTPPLGSILYMREVPDAGGDTMWISTQAAYDGLSEPMRAFCDKLIAWHHDPFFAADVEAKGGYEWDGKKHERLFPTSHPVVSEHPETGRQGPLRQPPIHEVPRRALTARKRDPARDALPPLHHEKPEYSCRFRWRPGSVAFWDNRATMHYALDDYGDAIRVAHRVTLRGDRPYGPARPAEKAEA
jgi:alpha-ketoglutarate-dependent taurine dioxygenase